MTEMDDSTTGNPNLLAVSDAAIGPFAEHLGLHLIEVSASKVVATWAAAVKHHQPHGIIHGGVHCSVVETLGSVGAALWVGDRGRCVGITNTTDFLRPASRGPMRSVATPVHQGQSQQLWVTETFDARGRLVARGQVRVQTLPSSPSTRLPGR